MTKCVITGCALVVEAENKAVWGDLHRVGMDTYVFNACINDKGESAWDYESENVNHFLTSRRSISINPGADYFERRGVIVFRIADSKFNEVAIDYLLKQPDFVHIGQRNIRLGDEA